MMITENINTYQK